MKTEKKYKLTDECIIIDEHKLYRIEALKDFFDVRKGDQGGFIEREYNLSHNGYCWVYDDAKVYGSAVVDGYAMVSYDSKVYGSARVTGSARVMGNAKVMDYARVMDNAEVYNSAVVYDSAMVNGEAEIGGYAKIANNSDYIVFKNWWSSGRYFTWTRSNNMWRVGCFYGTGEELIGKAYNDSELSGREYERVVKYVESILKDSKK